MKNETSEIQPKKGMITTPEQSEAFQRRSQERFGRLMKARKSSPLRLDAETMTTIVDVRNA